MMCENLSFRVIVVLYRKVATNAPFVKKRYIHFVWSLPSPKEPMNGRVMEFGSGLIMAVTIATKTTAQPNTRINIQPIPGDRAGDRAREREEREEK